MKVNSHCQYSFDNFEEKVHPKKINLLISDVRLDEIGRGRHQTFYNFTSGSEDICIQSSETCDMEAAILICKSTAGLKIEEISF